MKIDLIRWGFAQLNDEMCDCGVIQNMEYLLEYANSPAHCSIDDAALKHWTWPTTGPKDFYHRISGHEKANRTHRDDAKTVEEAALRRESGDAAVEGHLDKVHTVCRRSEVLEREKRR
ncbi:hypothetical protein Trydic_g17772 [Trypoxylus dichotomus]